MHFIGFLIFGLIIGLIARALMPGRQSIGIVLPSLLGGFLGTLLFGRGPGEPVAAGWIGSIIGALLLLGVFASTRRSRI